MSTLDFKKPEPLSLEGNLKENYKKFKQRYDIYATATKTNKEDSPVQVARFLSCAGDTAIELFNTFCLTEEEKKNVGTVMKSFEDYCNPRNNEVFERYKFYSRNQHDGEPFDHFMAEIIRLAENCNFGEQKESMLRDRVVIGVADKNVQAKLLKTDALTLDKAKEYCRVAELTESQAKHMQEKSRYSLDEVARCSQGSSSRLECNQNKVKTKSNVVKNYRMIRKRDVQQPNSEMNGRRKTSSSTCKFCGRTHRFGNCPAYGKKCNMCNRKNHFASVCSRKINQVSDIACVRSSENENECLYIDLIRENYKENRTWCEKLIVNDMIIEFKLDSGAEVNILPKDLFEQFKCKPKIEKNDAHLEAFGGHKINSLGCVTLPTRTVNSDESLFNISYVLVDLNVRPILGLPACVELGLIKKIGVICTVGNKQKFMTQNRDVFTGSGKFPEECTLELKEGAIPVHKPPRRVPLSLRERLKSSLSDMENRGIIAKKYGPSEWSHNLIIVEKQNGSLRLCLDPKELNSNIKFEHFLIPKLEDFRYSMRCYKVFSVLDLKEGFWQLPLTEKSKELTVFSTPFGSYCFNVLPFGVSAAPEKFQKLNEKYFGSLPGCFIYIDDIIVGGRTLEEHDANLQRVIERARQINVKFNPDKFQYQVSKVKYLGHIFSEEGMSPDPERIAAIKNMEDPKNKRELQKVMGTLNYLREFIPKFSEINAPLRSLLKKDIVFQWTPYHSRVLNSIKETLNKTTVLHSFDPEKEIVIQTDASQNGLGCCLSQNGKPIAFASKSLNSAECNYAQIEKEFLAIVYAV